MWPWGHAALGYLAYRLLPDGSEIHASRLELAALLFGTQAPDLVDKPLAWTVTILPSGRSFAHSIFTLVAFAAFAWVVARRVDRPQLAAIASFGYASHLVGDALAPLLRGEFQFLAFLVWPLLPLPEYGTDKSFLAHFQGFTPTGFTLFGLVLSVVALAVFVATEYGRRRRT